MLKKTLGIVGGKGQMGAFFVRVFAEQGFNVLVSDLGTALSNKELAKKSDIVVISVPIDRTEAVIKEVAPHLKKSALLMDLTSVKAMPLTAMMSAFPGSVLGCHPLFGPTNGIKNQIIVLTPGRGQKWQNFIQRVFETAGAQVKIVSAEEHDEIMAMVQGLTHFISITFAKTLAASKTPLKKFLDFQTAVYRITMDFLGRILNQDPALYGNIQIKNSLTQEHIKAFLQAGEEFLKIVEAGDLKRFIAYFDVGKRYLGKHTAKFQRESDELIDFFAQKLVGGAGKDFWENQPKKAEMAILGPRNTYSHLAAEKYFPKNTKLFCRTIAEVFDAVESNRAHFGLVPIENKIEGTVSITLDRLFRGTAQIQAMHTLEIFHAFSALKGVKKTDIKTIYSHPQALAQCADFLRKTFPRATLLPLSSTAEAVAYLQKSQDKTAGAISSLSAAESAGLQVMIPKIPQAEKNETRFCVIAKNPLKSASKPQGKVSLAFTTKDEPGALLAILQEFANEKINLTRIESRPTKKKFGEFVFFIDLEGGLSDRSVKKSLARVEAKTKVLKVLGAW